jgi:hypothetical protein
VTADTSFKILLSAFGPRMIFTTSIQAGINPGEVTWGTIGPALHFYVVACTFLIPLPTTLLVSARSITISCVTVVVWWGVIHKLCAPNARNKYAKYTVKLCAKFAFIENTHLFHVITAKMTFFPNWLKCSFIIYQQGFTGLPNSEHLSS